eukprot:g14846.t1
MAKTDRLFEDDNPLALRQKNTEPLILPRLLDAAGKDQQLEDAAKAVYPILLRWADLESSGQLTAETHETQLQGPFFEDIFGKVLGYHPVNDPTPDGTYHLEQEFHVGSTGTSGGHADAALGLFKPGQDKTPLAVVELKGANIHLDRARSNGRNAVAQCWDYLYASKADCRWGIVSNFVSFRLYDRTATPAKYEHFTLQSLRKFDVFRRFYAIFHRKGLIEKTAGQDPRILGLIKKTNDRQREVGDELYGYYSTQRTELIAHLMADHGQPLDMAIEMAQRLFDRIIFIAFCEDRGLLPDNTLRTAHDQTPGFSTVTNPIWQNYKSLFRFVDNGSEPHGIPHYNGGLFAEHPVDDLDLDDGAFTTCFRQIGEYDFGQEVNLDVLGHLFERSITEIEKLKATGLFGGDTDKARQYAQMPQSAKRKQFGTYYTPAVLTERIVRYTVDELIDERFDALAKELNDEPRITERYWQGCFDILRNLKIVDPACGSGAFLFQAYQAMALRYGEVIDQLIGLSAEGAEDLHAQVPKFILNDNLYGVDLSPEAVEISQLALWIQSADKTQTLATLSHNIVLGNSLVHDPEVAEHGFDWKDRFPEVFSGEGFASTSRDRQGAGETPDNASQGNPLPHGRGSLSQRQPGFDCVIGNPPWERIKLQEREFFSLPAPEIATASNAAKRRKLGDINTYAVFAELATKLVAPNGRVGLLVPSGIASDKTTKDFFAEVAENDRLIRLYDFENKKVFFPEVHASFKFSILNVGGVQTQVAEADFIFFANSVDEIEDTKRHVQLTGDDIKLLNPNTRTCPIFRTRRDAEITKAIYRRVPVLIDKSRKKTGNPWGVTFKRMFDQTNDAELFREAATLQQEGFKLDGNRWVKGKKIGGVTLNFFIVEQLPTLSPDRYDEPCPWDGKQTLEQWISERVLKLSCTAEDMLTLAEACGFFSGSFKEYDGKLNKWNERERALLMAELDAAYFILYGLDRSDSEYILSTFKGIHNANPLFGGQSTAEHILDTYDDLSARSMGE